MKFSTASTAAALVANVSLSVHAFGPPAPSYTQRHALQQQATRQSTTRLSLINMDPILATSVMESTSTLTSLGDVVDTLGSLALIGSIGFGVFAGRKDWNYEYKPGNDEYSEDLALLEESPASVLEKVTEEDAAAAAEEPVAAVAAPEKPKPAAPEKKPEPAAPEKKPEPAAPKKPAVKRNIPSKEILESTEKAKNAVQKKGVQETKDKMSSKISSSEPAKVEEVKAASTTAMEVTKTQGGKRRFAKGITLIVAAGAVAVARNVVKAYLGRGML